MHEINKSAWCIDAAHNQAYNAIKLDSLAEEQIFTSCVYIFTEVMSAFNRWLRGTRPYGTQKQSETPGAMAGQPSNHKFMRASHQFIKSSNTHFDFG